MVTESLRSALPFLDLSSFEESDDSLYGSETCNGFNNTALTKA